MISSIAAIGENNEIGKKNALLWNLSADMEHFREITRGHTVIMGQKTFESIGRPLPNRKNIVVTKDESFNAPGVEISYDLDEIIERYKNKPEEVFVIGGAQIYSQTMAKADKLYITHVKENFPDADAFFPVIDEKIWQKTKSEIFKKDERNKYDLEFAEYEKLTK